MRKRYQKILVCVGLALGLTLFTACQGGDEADKSAQTQPETEAVQDDNTDDTADGAKEGTAQPETDDAQDDGGEEGPDAADLSDYEEKTREYLGYIFSGELEKAEAFDYTDEMQTFVDDDGLKAFDGFESQVGAFEGITEIQVEEVQGYYAATATCLFEQYEVVFIVSFTEDGSVAGFAQASFDVREEEEAALPPSGVIEEELSLVIDEDHQLGGTLSLPEGEGPFPAVVLVHGSGSSDRNENIFGNKPFRDIAWGLTQQGIAVYRYDKRTYVFGAEQIGGSFGLYEETVQDAGIAVRTLREDARLDSTRIYVAGHSQGGLAIPLIHEDSPADGYIMLAGPARRLDDIMIEQYNYLMNLEEDLSESDRAVYEEAIAEVERLSKVEELDDDEVIMGIEVSYWKTILLYDQLKTAQSIDRPVLVQQGEEDYQVTLEDYNLWQEAFGQSENWSFKTYPGLTHLFMPGSLGNGSADYMTPQNVAQEVIDDMAAFILE